MTPRGHSLQDSPLRKCRGLLLYPKPVLKPHPPIWFGGFADGALRGIAQYGDAWHAGGTPEMLSQGYAKVEQYGKEYVRDPDSIAVTRRGDGIGRRETAQTIEELRPDKDAASPW